MTALRCALAVLALLPPATDAVALEWTPQQQALIKRLHGQVAQEDGLFTLRHGMTTVKTEVDVAFTAQLACYLERMTTQITELLGLGAMPQQGGRPTVHILRDRERYRQLMGTGTNSRGWFRYCWNNAGVFTEFTLYSFIEYERERDFAAFYLPILHHEGVHLILQSRAGRRTIPVLFNEGLAAYFQGWDFERDLAANQRDRRSAYRRLISGPLTAADVPLLVDLHAADPWDVDGMGRQTMLRYLAAELFTEMQLADDTTRRAFRALLLRMLQGTADDRAVRRWLMELQPAFTAYLLAHADQR